MTFARDAVVVGFTDLKDKFVCAQQSQQPTDARRTVLGIARSQRLAQISISEALQREFAMQNDLKQVRILRANRPQGAIWAFIFDPLADTIQQLVGRCFQSHYGERIQVASISGVTQFRPAAQVSYTLAQGQPFHHRLTVAQSSATNFETS